MNSDSTDEPANETSRLDELLEALFGERIEPGEIVELEHLLAARPDARHRYIRFLDLHCSLKRHYGIRRKAFPEIAEESGREFGLDSSRQEDSGQQSQPEEQHHFDEGAFADGYSSPGSFLDARESRELVGAGAGSGWRRAGFLVASLSPLALAAILLFILQVGGNAPQVPGEDGKAFFSGKALSSGKDGESAKSARAEENWTPDAIAVVTHDWGASWRGPSVEPRVGNWLVPSAIEVSGNPMDRGSAHEIAEDGGAVQIQLNSGASLRIEPGSTVRLSSSRFARIQGGRLTARVPPDVAAFAIEGPRATLFGAGAEFAMQIDGDVCTVRVFLGTARLIAFDIHGGSFEDRILLEGDAWSIDSFAERLIRPHDMDLTLRVDRTPTTEDPGLDIPASYEDAILADGPAVYWRFEGDSTGVVNSVKGTRGHFGGVLVGQPLSRGDERNHWIEFPDDGQSRMVLCKDSLAAINANSYTVELWALPTRFKHMTLVSVHKPEAEGAGRALRHLSLNVLEMFSRQQVFRDWPTNSIRFTHRSPPHYHSAHGWNVFSTPYRPGRWTHIVATKTPEEVRLYVDGKLISKQASEKNADEDPYVLVLGKLDRTRAHRQFVGSLDEFALYPRALAADEIAEHFALVRER